MINLKMDAFRFFFFQYGNIFLNPISGLNKRKRIHRRSIDSSGSWSSVMMFSFAEWNFRDVNNAGNQVRGSRVG